MTIVYRHELAALGLGAVHGAYAATCPSVVAVGPNLSGRAGSASQVTVGYLA